MNEPTAQPRELKGVHVLAAMLLFFGAIIATNVAFSIVAIRSFPGEDERRSYLQGLRFNETLAQRSAQQALGWRATAGIEGRGDMAVISVQIADRAGRPVSGLTLDGKLRRPATTRDDIEFVFRSVGNGVYSAEVRGLAAGGWTLHATASRGTEQFELERRLTWTPPR